MQTHMHIQHNKLSELNRKTKYQSDIPINVSTYRSTSSIRTAVVSRVQL